MATQIDIGIITIRDDEHRAVLSAFPVDVGDGIHKGRVREYALREASAGTFGRYTVAVVRLPEQGNGEALDAARDMLEDFEMSLLLVVGIAGGLPSDDYSLGDIVLSTRINDYSVEARREMSEPTYAISGGPIAKQILGGVANLAAREKDLGNWAANLGAKPPVSWGQEGELYGPPEWQEKVRASLSKHYGPLSKPRPPLFTAGPIASSDRLVKDPSLLFPWIATARNILAVEMESGGVYRAARERCPMLAIRALSDIIGLTRANEWTKYAAEAAAAFSSGYLQTAPVSPRGNSSPTDAPPSAGGTVATPPVQNALHVTGGSVHATNIVVGEQHVHNASASSASYDAIEKLVDNGLLTAATEQLGAQERLWSSIGPHEKFRHRKLQGRVLARRGQPKAAADRFMEAADFVPLDEGAQVLRVRALMLRGDLRTAHELATNLIGQYPNLPSARAVWISSAPEEVPAEELVAPPWDGLAPEIAGALADRLLDRDRAKEALEVLQRTHSPGRDLSYWATYSVALLKVHEQLGADKGPPDLLNEALSALDAAYRLCAGEGLEQAKLQALLNIGYVHRLLGNQDEEWRVLRNAEDVAPENADVRIRIAKVLTERGQLDKAVTMFEDVLNDGPDYVPFLLGVALAKRGTEADLNRATDLFRQTARLAKPSEPLLRVDGAEGLVQVRRHLKSWESAIDACSEFVDVLGVFRSKELQIRIQLERGERDAARAVVRELAEGPMTDDQQRTLGTLAHQCGEDELAFGLLEPVARRNEWNESTAALLTAAQATDRDEITVRICRDLKAAGIVRNSLVEFEAVALQRQGQVVAAIEVVQQALASQEEPLLRLRLSMLGIAANRPGLIEKDPQRLPNPRDCDPHVAVMAVGVLRAAGVHEVAIRYAYAAYRANRGSSDGWRAIIEAFLPIAGPTNHVEPEVVAIDAAVVVAEGQHRRWVIVEGSEPEAEHGELSPENPMCVAMMGKKVGETFQVARGAAPPRTYRVEEIRSKYVRAYQTCLEQWEEQFPDVPGPIMIEVPADLAENADAFIERLKPMLVSKAQQVEKLDQLYAEKPVSFHMLATGLGSSVFGAMAHLITETETDLRCTRSLAEDITRALALLGDNRKLILDVTALSTLMLLDEVAPLFAALAGRLAIAQATIDEVTSHLREVEGKAAGFIGVRDGHMIAGEISDESRTAYQDRLRDLVTRVSGCEVFREAEHDLLGPEEWDRLVEIGGSGAVESLHRAMRTGEPVWSDDAVLALVAHERRVGVVWTQLVCHHLLVRRAIDTERANRISAKLVGWRYVSTSTTPGIFLEAARLASWNPDHWPLRQHIRLFEVESWDDKATFSLAINIVREWWCNAPSDMTANAVMSALLDRIALRNNGDALLIAIDRVLEKAFGLDVLTYRRARTALNAWARARKLRSGL